MANTLSKTGVVTGQTIEALQVSQSVDAFTGGSAYDITISGSLTLTGSLLQTGSVFFKQITQVQATASNQLGNLSMEKQKEIDLLMIDRRFRVACCLKSFNIFTNQAKYV